MTCDRCGLPEGAGPEECADCQGVRLDRLREAVESVIVRMDDGSVRLREWDRSPTELADVLAAALDKEQGPG